MNPLKVHVYLLFVVLFGVHVECFKRNRSKLELGFIYHNYTTMTKFLHDFVAQNSNIASLYSIGKSVQDRELWVVKISMPKSDLILKSNIKLIGNIHGNEVVGKEILLHFLMYIAKNIKMDERISHILKNSNIHILPSLNPDGYEVSLEGHCTTGPGRKNANKVDLNRSFPDFFQRNPQSLQPETKAVIRWMNNTKFILSASLHGGALVANYPFESTMRDGHSDYPTPDDDVFQHLSLIYSKSHSSMHLGQTCPNDYYGFKDGITNGAAWYAFIGGMQDYNYAMHGCMEVTLEISCCKYPKASNIQMHWRENKNALINFCLQSGYGVKGIVKNFANNEPIWNADLTIDERNMTFHTTSNGEFYRILLPGVYSINVSAKHYEPTAVMFEVKNPDKIGHPEMTILEIHMTPLSDDAEKEAGEQNRGSRSNDDTPAMNYAKNVPLNNHESLNIKYQIENDASHLFKNSIMHHLLEMFMCVLQIFV